MGNGYRDGAALNFQITATYDMTAGDLGLWERAFSKASELLWAASNGQLRFGRIIVTENRLGINNAEFALLAQTDGRALGTWGGFGHAGQSVQLLAYAQRSVLSIIHELGHHGWALDEEYARTEGAAIDTASALPAGHANTIIPLTTATLNRPDADYAGASAILILNQLAETRSIVSKAGKRITVTPGFPQSPQNADAVTVQWAAECTGDRSTGACVMEFSRDSAGTLAPDGTWTAAANPVTEFCTTANHDPDADTAQEDTYGQACWETIVGRPGFGDLSAPAAGASPVAVPAGWVAPTWTVASQAVRLALVLDRSGSMSRNGGARMAGVRTGAQYWVENGAVEDDELSIVWYSAGPDIQLPLTEFSTLTAGDVSAQVNTIAAQAPGGPTNIRDGLRAALGELTSPAAPAALQAAVVITDGAHNTPAGSRMDEVVSDFRAANTNIYTLGVGTGAEMDLPGLAALASATGGAARTAGDGFDANAIQDALIEINAMVRGGVITAGGTSPDTKEAEDRLDRLGAGARSGPVETRPDLERVAETFRIVPWQKAREGAPGGRFTFFDIELERDVASATFTLSHDRAGRFWMYLVAPDGREVRPGDGDVIAWVDSPRPYEFAKVSAPMAGVWTVVALRLDRGAPLHMRAVTAVNHPEVAVHAESERDEDGRVLLTGGARYSEPLTGISIVATVSDGASTFGIVLDDAGFEGAYRAEAALPDGHYSGYVEFRTTGAERVAGLVHAVLHAQDPGEVVVGLPEISPFVRHVPISFTVGPVEIPEGVPEDELHGKRGRPLTH